MVGRLPGATYYKPNGIPTTELEILVLTLDEYEAVRLADFDQQYQEEAARKMGVSRQTFGRIVESAHYKIADALTHGKALKIEGGEIALRKNRHCCPRCGNPLPPGNTAARPTQCPYCKILEISKQPAKEKQMFVVAIPTDQHLVDPHFGHTGSYTLFTVDENRRIISEETVDAPAGCGCKSNIVGTFVQKGVSVLLAGNIGGGAITMMGNHGIQVVRGCSGDVRAAAEQWLAGSVVDSGLTCESHERECEQ